MKHGSSTLTPMALVVAIGCTTPDPGLEQKRALNAWLLTSLENEATENAIVRQSTLYPYHFVHDAAELNELGGSDLDTLAAHFARHGGKLNLHQGEASAELYAQRKEHILEELALRGVADGKVVITEGIPGGDGADSERVLTALTEPTEIGTKDAKSASGQGPSRATSTTGLK